MAAALPLALLLGFVGELVVTSVLRIGRQGGAPSLRRQLRAAAWPRGGRPTVAEAGGVAAAMLGAAVAAGSALGLGPGSAALMYLGLVVAAVGGHVAASSANRERAAGERLRAALIEPAFVVSLGAMLIRWGSSDLDAIRGTQTVLGPGVALRPVGVAAGLALAGLLVAVSGALRFASRPPDLPASGLLIRLGRSAGAGATALAVAVLVGGADVPAATVQQLAVFAGAAVAAAVVVAISGVLLQRLRGRPRLVLAAVLLMAAAASVVLVLA
jgi:hypothetical protein